MCQGMTTVSKGCFLDELQVQDNMSLTTISRGRCPLNLVLSGEMGATDCAPCAHHGLMVDSVLCFRHTDMAMLPVRIGIRVANHGSMSAEFRRLVGWKTPPTRSQFL